MPEGDNNNNNSLELEHCHFLPHLHDKLVVAKHVQQLVLVNFTHLQSVSCLFTHSWHRGCERREAIRTMASIPMSSWFLEARLWEALSCLSCCLLRLNNCAIRLPAR